MTTRTTKTKKATVQSFAAEVQGKAKAAAQTAFGKGSAIADELGAITKGNVEAVLASGQILGAGLKELGEGSITEGKQAVDTFVADLKAFAAVKSPTEFFNLQLKVAKRNVDTALAVGSKNGKALGELASAAAAPLSSQVKANLAKLRQAA